MNRDTVARTADAFDENLRKAISPAQYRLIRKRNRTEPNEHVCHSHDFCDPNMLMLDALMRVTGRTEDQVLEDVGNDGPLTALWNAAWDVWKAR